MFARVWPLWPPVGTFLYRSEKCVDRDKVDCHKNQNFFYFFLFFFFQGPESGGQGVVGGFGDDPEGRNIKVPKWRLRVIAAGPAFIEGPHSEIQCRSVGPKRQKENKKNFWFL